MKWFMSLLVIASFYCVSLNQAYAWPWDKKDAAKDSAVEKKEKQPAAANVKSQAGQSKPAEKSKPASEEKIKQDEEAARKAKRALVEQKRKEINNIEWELQMTPLSGKGKPIAETATFRNMQVSFSEFGKKGFTASNFSLKIQEDKIVVWETMQTAEKAGVAFWRGEISADLQKMRGVVSYQTNDKKKEDYSFISTNRKQLE
jgi:hypothetical protein